MKNFFSLLNLNRLMVRWSFAGCVVVFQCISALPTDPTVVAGQAHFVHPNSSSVVVTTSDKAIIDYGRFNISKGESVTFIQPHSTSCVLNRINGREASSILGELQGNGRVFLINPHGIYFGPSAVVSTGSLIASTLDLSNEDFLNERYDFHLLDNHCDGEIINQGSLVSTEGSVVLLASKITNEGLIASKVGEVLLAGAKRVSLDFTGDGLMQFALDGDIEEALIENRGMIEASNGCVSLRLQTAQRAIQEVINTDGLVMATHLVQENGVIRLVETSHIRAQSTHIESGENSLVEISGLIDSSAIVKNQTGGTVKILGEEISVSQARIETSGESGGGSIYIGGDQQGKGDLFLARKVNIDDTSVFRADALNSGDGGKVIVWSDADTVFNGKIFARGGSHFGDGGFVETSGKDSLIVDRGRVNTSAPFGRFGNWLLDPSTINVVTGGGGTLAAAAVCGGAALSIDPLTIEAATTNVVLCASTSVTVTNAINMTGASTVGVGITMTNASGATVPITLNAGIATNGGALNLNGAVTLGASVTLDTTQAGTAAGAPIVVNGSIEGAHPLVVTAGIGSIDVTGSIGDTTALTTLSMTGNGGITLGNIGAGVANGATNVTLNSTTGVTCTGTIYNATSFSIPADITLANNATFTASAASGSAFSFGNIDGDGVSARNLTIKTNAGSTATLTVSGCMGCKTALNNIGITGNAGVVSLGSFNVSGTALVPISSTAGITLNGGAYSSEGNLQFTGPCTLGTNTTITTSSTATLDFTSTIDGGFAMNLSPTGILTLGGSVGSVTPLTSFTLSPGGATTLGGAVYKTVGNQSYGSNVTFSQNIAFSSTPTVTGSGTINFFSNTLNASSGSGSPTLTMTTAGVPGGDIQLGSLGNSGGSIGAVSLTANGGIGLSTVGTGVTVGAVTLSTRTGIQFTNGAYNAASFSLTGDLTCTGNITMTTTGAAGITFNGNIDSIAANRTLTLSTSGAGPVAINGDIGSTTAMSTISITGTAISLRNIGGAAVGSTGSVTLTGPITWNGGTINTTGTMTFAGATTLETNANVKTTTGNIAFNSTINGLFSLGLNSGGSVITSGSVGNSSALTSLAMTAASGLNLNGGTYNTSGSQTYNNVATLGANTTFTTTNSPVVFGSTIDVGTAGQSLTINAGTGSVNVSGSIGSSATTAIGAVTITGNGGVTLTGVGVGIPSTGALSVTSLAGTVLNGGTYSALSHTFTGDITLGANTTLTSSSNNPITLNGAIDSDLVNPRNLTLNAGTGAITVGGDIGSHNPLGTIQMTGGSISIKNIGNATAGAGATTLTSSPGGITLNEGIIKTSGTISFNGPVTLATHSNIVATGNILFSSTIDGNFGLGLTATGSITSSGAIGSITPLALLSMTAPSGIILNGSTYTTLGVQTYNNAVQIGTNSIFTTTNKAVTFVSTVNTNVANSTFTVNAGSGSISVGGAIGSTATAIGAVTLTGNGGITLNDIGLGTPSTGAASLTSLVGILLNGGTYSALSHSYSGNVTLGANTTITSATNNNILINGTIDGDNISTRSLTLSTGSALSTGTITINGSIGTAVPLGAMLFQGNAGTITLEGIGSSSVGGLAGFSFDSTATPGITLNGSIYSTSGGSQNFNGSVELGGDTTLISTNNSINFSSTVDGGHQLSIEAGTGSISVGGAIGGTTPLGVLTISSANGVSTGAISALAVQEIGLTGANTFGGAITTSGTQGVLIDGSTVTFSNGVTTSNGGPLSIINTGLLTLPSGFTYSIDGPVTQVGGGSVSTGTNITTTTTTNGDIYFTDPMVLVNSIAFNSSASNGNISLGQVDGTTAYAQNLSLNPGSGNINFNGPIGSLVPLGNITIVNVGNLIAPHSISAVTLTQDAGIGLSEFMGPITLNGTTGSPLNLTGNSFTFDNSVTIASGGSASITNTGLLTISSSSPFTLSGAGAFNQFGGGAVSIAANITTQSEPINFTGPVTLMGALQFSTSALGGGPITFGSTLDGTFPLTLSAGTAGAILMEGAVGSVSPLGALTITGASSVTANAISAASIDETGSTGANVFNGVLSTTGAAGIVLHGTTINLNQPVITKNSGPLMITNSGLLTIAQGADVTLSGGLTQLGGGNVSLASDILTSGQPVQFAGAIGLAGPASITTNDGNISLLSTVDGDYPFALSAGTGSISVGGAIGGTTPLGVLTISSANGVSTEAISALAVQEIGPTGANLFGGAITTSGSQGVLINGSTVTFSSGVTTTNGGPFTIINTGLLTLPNGFTYSIDGPVNQSGGGSVSTGTNITTNNSSISFADPLTLTDSITLDSGTQTGNISFGSTVDGDYNLTASAGLGTVYFDGAVGSAMNLASLTASGIAIVQNSDVSTVGGVTYTGDVSLGGDITTTNGSILITGDVLRTNVTNETVTAGGLGSQIVISGDVNGDISGRNMTFNAPLGSITVDGSIGDVTALNDLLMTADTISIGNIGGDGVGVDGQTTLDATSVINFNGTSYFANAQSYTADHFFLNAHSGTVFSAFDANQDIVFAGTDMTLSPNNSLSVLTNNGDVSLTKIIGDGSQSLFTYLGTGTLNLGEIDPLYNINLNGGELLIGGPISTRSIYMTAQDNISNVAGSNLIQAIDIVFMDAINGFVGSAASPIHIDTAIAVAGAEGSAYFTGVTLDNTVHCLPTNPPKHLFWNGVDIDCHGPIPPKPPKPPKPPIPPFVPGSRSEWFYNPGIYSFYNDLGSDLYFLRDWVGCGSVCQPYLLYYGCL